MENLDARGMESVTSYAPVRIALLAIGRTIFGLLIGLMGAVALWATWGGDMGPTKPGDMPVWWMYVVGAALAFTGFLFVSGGLGRMVSAMAKDCYFKAGPDGIAIRMPKQGWFGRFQLVEYKLGWNEIKQLVHFSHRINLIPVSSELRIELAAGGSVVIERHFFSATVKEIRETLLRIGAAVGR